METIIFTQLSVSELREIIQEELSLFFSRTNIELNQKEKLF